VLFLFFRAPGSGVKTTEEIKLMATPLDHESLSAALKYIWSQYRTWAITARHYKDEVSRWRDIVLALSISGAVVGTLSQQLVVWNVAPAASWLVRGLGFVSAAALVLAAFFTKEIFSPDPEARAVRARAAAEAFKSQGYLLATGAPPYDAIATPEDLLEKPEKVRQAVENLAALTITEAQKIERMPSVPMPLEEYVRQRVDDQIEYYSRSATANTQKVAKSRRFSLILGAVAAVLGIVAATYASVAGWVAVIGTLTAAIAARQYAERYQFLIVSYRAAAEKLEGLKARWEIERKQNGALANQKFIHACEEAISAENSAWMAEWTKKTTSKN
jgi:conflict system pore-forming effector with SLATT domain/uncharacterized protein DUF4231